MSVADSETASSADSGIDSGIDSAIVSGVDPEVMAIYGRSASRYDRVNAVASFGTSTWYRRRTILSLQLPSTATLVDVGCGTGMLALAAQRYLPDSPSIVAVDPCPEMRALAMQAGVRDVRAGSFTSIPLEDRSRDAVVSGYAIRYPSDLDAAFREVHRVLRPGGRMVILEMIAPRPGWRRAALAHGIRDVGAPLLGLFCGARAVRELMRHFWDSVSSFDSPELVTERLRSAGFEEVEYRHVGGLLGEFRATRPAEQA